MSLVTHIFERTERSGIRPRESEIRRAEGSAEIHILPCIRRERMPAPDRAMAAAESA